MKKVTKITFKTVDGTEYEGRLVSINRNENIVVVENAKTTNLGHNTNWTVCDTMFFIFSNIIWYFTSEEELKSL